MSFDFSSNFDQPFFGGGTSTSVLAGTVYPASLGGVAYMLDTRETKVVHSSVPLARVSIDDKENTGRQTLNPDAFWRRSFESWHVGAGQTHFDRLQDSNPWRFRRSKNIDVWEKNQVSLLQATGQKLASVNTNLYLAMAGDYTYVTDGTALKRTLDMTPASPTFTTITGGTAAAFSSIASDGFNVLVACGASGIDKTTRGAATKANHITGTVTDVAYGKGRWIAAAGPSLYDVTTLVPAGGALPAALYTHPNSDWAWNSFAEGPTAFYVGGFSGDKSLIYRLTMKEDGTGLNQPVVAGTLPDGEIVRSMQGYLGFVLIGTSKGVRVGVVGGNGDLTIGAFIPTDAAVMCFEGQEQFVWFGWTNFEGTDSGLGRVDLTTFSDIDALAPAYASDLMSGVTGTVQACVTAQALRTFTVSGHGIYATDPANLAAQGQIDSGVFDYGLIDQKLSLFVDMSHVSTPGGSHSVYLSVDRSAFALLATMTDDHVPIGTGEARGQEFEIRVVITRSGPNPSLGPVLRSWALRSQPAARTTAQIDVPLLIGPDLKRLDGMVESVDSIVQADNIRTLCDTKAIVLYTEGDQAWSVIVDNYQLSEHEIYVGSDAALGINGTCLARLKVVS